MSPLRQLREAHGGSSSRQAINHAIRAECPGGAVALDRLEAWRHICERLGWREEGREEPTHVTAYRHILEIVDAMEDDVRQRWGMPPRGERGGLAR